MRREVAGPTVLLALLLAVATTVLLVALHPRRAPVCTAYTCYPCTPPVCQLISSRVP